MGDLEKSWRKGLTEIIKAYENIGVPINPKAYRLASRAGYDDFDDMSDHDVVNYLIVKSMMPSKAKEGSIALRKTMHHVAQNDVYELLSRSYSVLLGKDTVRPTLKERDMALDFIQEARGIMIQEQTNYSGKYESRIDKV